MLSLYLEAFLPLIAAWFLIAIEARPRLKLRLFDCLFCYGGFTIETVLGGLDLEVFAQFRSALRIVWSDKVLSRTEYSVV